MQNETQERGSIKIYALVGLIFYLLVAIFWVLVFFLVVMPKPDPNPGQDLSPEVTLFLSMLEIQWVIASMIGINVFLVIYLSIVFTGLAYSTNKKINDNQYTNALTFSLILGILGLLPFFGGFLGGIFYLLVYSNLRGR